MLEIGVRIFEERIDDLIKILTKIKNEDFGECSLDFEGEIYIEQDEMGRIYIRDYKSDKAILDNNNLVDCIEDENEITISLSQLAKGIVIGEKRSMDTIGNMYNDVDFLYKLTDKIKDAMKYRSDYEHLIGWYATNPEDPAEYINFVEEVYEIGKNNI